MTTIIVREHDREFARGKKMYGARFVVAVIIFMFVSAVVFVYPLFGHLLRFNQLETLQSSPKLTLLGAACIWR